MCGLPRCLTVVPAGLRHEEEDHRDEGDGPDGGAGDRVGRRVRRAVLSQRDERGQGDEGEEGREYEPGGITPLTAPRTARGGREAGRNRIRSAPRIRSAASASLTRCWPSPAVASSTARISSSLSLRNDRG